jgi:hypothetical protein
LNSSYEHKDYFGLSASDWRTAAARGTNEKHGASDGLLSSRSIDQRKKGDSTFEGVFTMRSTKRPREQNPYFLTGRGKKKPWYFLLWNPGRKD